MAATIGEKNTMLNKIKVYLFPTLVSLLSIMIWRDVTELRSDVKMLLAQANVDKTEIENLKKNIEMLNGQVFKTVLQTVTKNYELFDIFILHDKYFKHEDIFDIEKYLPKS
jgi:hypothetical protein